MTSFPMVQRFNRSGEKEKGKTRPRFRVHFFVGQRTRQWCWHIHFKMKWRLNESADQLFSGSIDLFSCCVLVALVFVGSLRSNTVCYVLCSWPIGSSCCRLHAISLNFARENSMFLSQTLIFNAVVCLLALNVFFFLSLQPLERRCSLTKGVSNFLLILSCPLQWNVASLST